MARFTRIASYPSRFGELVSLGNGKYIDNSVKQTTVTNNGTALTTDHAGRTNKAFAFDGTNDKINCGNANYTGAVSWLLYVKPKTPADAAVTISKGYSNTTQFSPNIRQMLRTTNNALNTQTYYAAGLVAGPANTSNTWVNNSWGLIGGGFRVGSGFHYFVDSGFREDNIANVNTSWSAGYAFLLGSTEAGQFAAIDISYAKIYSRYQSQRFYDKLRNYWRSH